MEYNALLLGLSTNRALSYPFLAVRKLVPTVTGDRSAIPDAFLDALPPPCLTLLSSTIPTYYIESVKPILSTTI